MVEEQRVVLQFEDKFSGVSMAPGKTGTIVFGGKISDVSMVTGVGMASEVAKVCIIPGKMTGVMAEVSIVSDKMTDV